MGAAKRRGTREERVAQAVERGKAEAARLSEQHRQQFMRAKAEREARSEARTVSAGEHKLEKRDVAILDGGSPRALHLAHLLGLLSAPMPVLAVNPAIRLRRRDV
jgi:hypothetical protein